jgi:hypothetical protein
MTVGMIIGLIGVVFSWILMAAINKQHREETGVNMPTRSALRNLRRRARKQGISEEEAYTGWVERKQKKLRSDFKSTPVGTTSQRDDVPPDPTPTEKATRTRSAIILLLIASPFIAFAAFFVVSEGASSTQYYATAIGMSFGECESFIRKQHGPFMPADVPYGTCRERVPKNATAKDYEHALLKHYKLPRKDYEEALRKHKDYEEALRKPPLNRPGLIGGSNS